MSGTVMIGQEVFVGAGSVIAHNINIGHYAVIASGQSIYKNVRDSQTVVEN